MKAEYDKETDTVTITLRDARVKESDEIRPGVIADFGYDGGVVGFEILQASKVVEEAGEMQFAIADHESPIANHFLWSPFIFLPSSLLLRCRSGELVWYNFSYERSNSAAERNERRREAANHGGALAKSLS